MISLRQFEDLVKAKLPDAEVSVRDMKGGDHLEATVISSEFEGKSRVQQHQLVYSAVQAEMVSEAIHALALKTYTPQAWKVASQAV